MVSKCCWRPETGNDNRAASENPDTEVVIIEQEPNNGFTENNLLNSSYEDDVDHKLETDLSHSKSSNNNYAVVTKRKLVKFHDESQVHEIPSKPKRTPKGEQIYTRNL